MAVLQQQNVMGGEEELKKKQALSQPQTFGGQSTQAGGPTVPGNQTPGSGRFVNLQKYLSASGPNAGGQIAQKISGKAEEKSKQAGEATTQAEGIRQAVESTKTKYEGAAQPLVQKVGAFAGTANQAGNADLDEQSQNEIKNLMSQGYVKEAQELQQKFNPLAAQAASKVGSAQQYIQDLGSEKGRYNLLQDVYRRPQYGAGQQRLDQLLLQQQPGTSGGLTQLQKGLNQGLSDTQKTLQGIQGVTGQTFNDIISAGQKSGEEVKNALLGGSSAIDARQDLELTSEKQTADALYNQLAGLAKSEGDIELTKDLAEKSGLLPILQQYSQQSTLPEGSQQGMKSGPRLDGTTTGQQPLSANVYNLFNPENFASVFGSKSAADTFTKSQMYDEDEANRFNLLNQLAGTGASIQAGKRGSYLDTSRLSGALKSEQEAFDTAASQKMLGYGALGGHTSATAGATLKDYIQSGQDLSKTLYGMSTEELNQKAREQMNMHGMSQNEPINAGIMAQIQAQALASKGYEQGVHGEHLGDYNLARIAAENQVQSQLANLLKSSGYGRKLVVK